MLRPRIIPCLLVHRGGLVKSQGFKDYKYVGDPINAVRIFNEKEADELIVLDIDATVSGVDPNFELISKLAAECRMPLCYGGGVSTASQVAQIVDMGVEKVALSSAAIANPQILASMADAVGKQSIVTVIDFRRRKGLFAKGYEVCTNNGNLVHKIDPISLAINLEAAGAGEIVFNSIDCDGLMTGYDLDFAASVREKLSVPITFLGGAGTLDHIGQLVGRVGVVGAAAGSLFVFKGKYRAVLINYPTPEQKINLCRESLAINAQR